MLFPSREEADPAISDTVDPSIAGNTHDALHVALTIVIPVFVVLVQR